MKLMETKMSRKKGQTYSAEQKTKIVLELLKEEETIAQIAAKYKITSQSIAKWKKQFLENASLAFEPAKAVQEFKSEIKSKDEEIAELQKQLGKSVVEKEWLAKKLESSVSSKERKTLIESGLEITKSIQCKLLSVSRASYYYKPVPISKMNLKIMHTIDEIDTDNSEYGYRFIHQQLLEDGYSIGKDRVLKYMQFMDATLATDVLQEALSKYPKPKIFNSDQGSQYTSYEHTQTLKQYGIQISMNGKGRSIDNIVIERFFRTLKHSNIYISDYQSIKELKEGVKTYIHKYNFKRFHSSIGYKKPMNMYLEFIQNVG